ncbi:MAG: phosphate regulon transcriptional regulator PhoB [gamma proteobacterium symbiont of Taylorina sp.]|nr:phosphate regulon transcriptional regulator PhoB [gamma proteobacterium symbiont of Taylorina sp.]
MKKNILLVEDEKSIRDMIKFSLFNSDINLIETENVIQAQNAIAHKKPDLILLDWMLPGKDGVEFAKDLRANKKNANIPIIMLTAKSEEQDKIHGFSVGIDDYVVKPFSPRELIARIHAVLRRSGHIDKTILKAGDLEINSESHKVSYAGKKFAIGPLEYKLLYFFMSHTERVFSRDQLLDQVWGADVFIDERTVDVHIRRLRKTLSEFKSDGLIQTVRGSGYIFSTGNDSCE